MVSAFLLGGFIGCFNVSRFSKPKPEIVAAASVLVGDLLLSMADGFFLLSLARLLIGLGELNSLVVSSLTVLTRTLRLWSVYRHCTFSACERIKTRKNWNFGEFFYESFVLPVLLPAILNCADFDDA